MKDLIDSKRRAVHETGESSAVDILGQLVKGQESKEDGHSRAFLTDSEVMGNLIMFMIAGHETSANTIHLCVLFLALHPNVQRQIQAEVDSIFQSRPISKWSYDADIPHLLNGILGAVLNETLRVVPHRHHSQTCRFINSPIA
jgi:cytochrome P450